MTDVNFSNMSSFGDFLQAPNTATNGSFWVGMFYMLFIVMVIITSAISGIESGLILSAFIAILIGLFLAYAGLIGWWVIGTMVGIEIFMFLYVYWSSSRS